MLVYKGVVCLIDENLREVSVSFKTRGSVSVIWLKLKGGEYNFCFILYWFKNKNWKDNVPITPTKSSNIIKLDFW